MAPPYAFAKERVSGMDDIGWKLIIHAEDGKEMFIPSEDTFDVICL